MSPHPNLFRVRIRKTLDGGDRIQHIHEIARIAISACCLTFRAIMAPVIDAEDDVATGGYTVDVGDITLGCPIHVGQYIAVIEDDRRPSARGYLAIRNRQQAVNLEPF